MPICDSVSTQLQYRLHVRVHNLQVFWGSFVSDPQVGVANEEAHKFDYANKTHKGKPRGFP